MRSKIFILFIVLFLFSYRLFSQTDLIAEPINEFKTPEFLIYRIELLGIPIGWIELFLKEKTYIDNQFYYHINAKAYPNLFFKKFYNVVYDVDTYVDTKTFLPYRFQKIKFLKDNLISKVRIDFDWIKKKAFILDEFLNTKESIDLEDGLHDLLSTLYYFRLQTVEFKRDYKLKILYGNQIWPVDIKFISSQIMDIYRKGSFKVLEFELSTGLANIFLGYPKIKLYLINDSLRKPLIFYLRTNFGPVRGILKNIS
ncbi:MAG: DUF3108 domain-containing protein [Candidatus Omnitrophica bacterium]|nr:DUF3108 domain-containing protein [Candidatus Omnitrophota bacterium]